MADVCSIFKIRGRVGNTIFTERNGKCYARAVASSVKNPNTPKQQAVRNRFRVAVRFYQRLKETPLNEVWKSAGKKAKLTGFALFMRENLRMFNDQGKIADYDGLRLAVGSRYGAYDLSASSKEQNRVTLCWMGDAESAYLDCDDRLMVVVLHEDRAFSPEVVEGLHARREDGTVTFELCRREGVPVHLYCFFVASGNTAFSDSQHVVI